MRGRMIHDQAGRQESQLYDPQGGQVRRLCIVQCTAQHLTSRVCLCFALQCINSVERGILNEELLDQASSNTAVTVLFDHKLSVVDFDKRVATFSASTPDGPRTDVQQSFDLCIGADGSYSNVRRQLMRVVK